MTSIDSLARRLERIERDVIAVATQPRLHRSSVNGTLELRDIYGNIGGYVGQQFDGTVTVLPVGGPPPSQPTMPLVEPIVGGLRIYWDGTYDDGSVTRADFKRVTFHAVQDPDDLDILSPAQIVGSISIATGGEITASLPIVEHFVCAVVWTDSGKFSVESDFAFGTPLSVVDPEMWAEHEEALENLGTDLAANDAALATLNDTTLPALQATLAANDAALAELNDTTLPALQVTLAANDTALAELNDVTLPALQVTLNTHDATLATLNDTTLPALQDTLAANDAALATLNDTTLPALQDDLAANDAALTNLNNVVLPALQDNLDQAEQNIDTLQTDTLPTLQAELDAADLRLTNATASIEGDLGLLWDEVATLSTNTDSSLGEVSDLVAIINGATRSRHGIY